ncbi:hypothetical protein [Blastococcus mobilis]|uniref:Uncharacterized protein n=1 Tax=Blastococcus mobilis TaxID=1938746 RepID=A0A238XGX6_9ACTN|nr:hypothetical protein [Blastococcus mobilis]SNR57753.1 hypothetical protein SAMN06272737_11393 [Blastococcus mobilis]
MTRIPLDPPRSPLYRLAERYARRTYGVMPDPVAAMAHPRAGPAASLRAAEGRRVLLLGSRG